MSKPIMHLPHIDRADFSAFQSIMKDSLPRTYDAWRDWEKARLIEYGGDYEIVWVRLSPENFRRDAYENSREPDTSHLLTFAQKVGEARA